MENYYHSLPPHTEAPIDDRKYYKQLTFMFLEIFGILADILVLADLL